MEGLVGGVAGPEHMPETPFWRGRAALPGPRLSVFIQIIIRAPSDQYHWVFCQTGLPIWEKPHQHYPSEGIPDHVYPYPQMHTHFAQTPRANIIPLSSVPNETKVYTYYYLGTSRCREPPFFLSSLSPSVILCKRLRYGKFQGVLTCGSPLYLGLEKKPDLLSGTQFPECPPGEV